METAKDKVRKQNRPCWVKAQVGTHRLWRQVPFSRGLRIAIGVQAKASSTMDSAHQTEMNTINHRLTSLVRFPRKIRRYCSRSDTFVVAEAAL